MAQPFGPVLWRSVWNGSSLVPLRTARHAGIAKRAAAFLAKVRGDDEMTAMRDVLAIPYFAPCEPIEDEAEYRGAMAELDVMGFTGWTVARMAWIGVDAWVSHDEDWIREVDHMIDSHPDTIELINAEIEGADTDDEAAMVDFHNPPHTHGGNIEAAKDLWRVVRERHLGHEQQNQLLHGTAVSTPGRIAASGINLNIVGKAGAREFATGGRSPFFLTSQPAVASFYASRATFGTAEGVVIPFKTTMQEIKQKFRVLSFFDLDHDAIKALRKTCIDAMIEDQPQKDRLNKVINGDEGPDAQAVFLWGLFARRTWIKKKEVLPFLDYDAIEGPISSKAAKQYPFAGTYLKYFGEHHQCACQTKEVADFLTERVLGATRPIKVDFRDLDI